MLCATLEVFLGIATFLNAIVKSVAKLLGIFGTNSLSPWGTRLQLFFSLGQVNQQSGTKLHKNGCLAWKSVHMLPREITAPIPREAGPSPHKTFGTANFAQG